MRNECSCAWYRNHMEFCLTMITNRHVAVAGVVSAVVGRDDIGLSMPCKSYQSLCDHWEGVSIDSVSHPANELQLIQS